MNSFQLLKISFLFIATWLTFSATHSRLYGEDSTTASFAKQILPQLRDRDPAAAFKAFDTLIDQTLEIGQLAYSDLPSAAAGLHRSLAQLSSGEQYELLQAWTMPTADRKRVRMLAVPVPTDAPPKVFARSIGERPRDTTFIIASVGPVRGFFCSGWMLLQAANELGQLSQLRVKLEALTSEGVAGSEDLFVLSQLLGSRGDLDSVKTYLTSRSGFDDASPELTPHEINAAAIAAAALSHEETQAAAEAYLASLVARAEKGKAIGLRSFLRITHATAVQAYRGESSPNVLFEHRMKYWVPATIRSAKEIERGHPAAVWLAHEQHILHLAGGTADLLLFRYPIVGTFDFQCETQEGGAIGTDGGLVYGGLQFQALGRTNELTVWDADLQHQTSRPSPFARTDSHPVFNRVSIRSTDSGSQFESNFHPVWSDGSAVAASPWIGLRSPGSKRPVFRNLSISGKPVIQREVKLVAGNELRGWLSNFYEQSLPMFRESRSEVEVAAETKLDETRFDWQALDGELVASKQDDPTKTQLPGLLQYQRPLLENESITYQFNYQGETSILHPAVGRLAFLLEPSGIRLRWITTGESEWTGLTSDNAGLEPLNRRGPRTIPLREEQWNTVRVELAAGNIMIYLNDELIYQRPREPDAGREFGLYRTTRAADSRARNITMTGDWPAAIPDDFANNPVETVVAD